MLRVRLVPSDMLNPSHIHTVHFKAVLLLWICIVICIVILSLFCLAFIRGKF